MEALDKTKELETKDIGNLLWIYALPSVISQIIASVYNIVDRIFIGHGVGAMAIAGLAITMPIMNIVHAFGSLIGVGSSARMSIVLGRKDVNWAEKILGNSMIFTIVLGVLFVSCGYLFFTTMTFNLTGLIRASGYPMKSMFIMVGGAVLNMILDPIFIFGMHLGIAGAAWATTISMTTTAIIAVLHFVQSSSFIRFKAHGWQPKGYIFKNITLIGMSPFLMNVCASFVVAMLNNQLLHYGGDFAVGTYGIVNTFGSLMVMLILGICQGMQPIAGYNYGAGHADRLKHVYMLTMKVMRFLMVMFPLIGFTIVNSNFFQSIDKPWIAIVTSLSRQLIFLLPLAYIVPVLFTNAGLNGLTGIWAACTISDVMGAVLAAILLFSQRKIFTDVTPHERKVRKEAGPET